jgi:hypothetical protein
MATTFTRMDESTAEQWGVIGTESYKNQSRVADRVLGMLESLSEIVDGFATDQLTHCLQTATLAERAGADEQVVVAALCHDIGTPARTIATPSRLRSSSWRSSLPTSGTRSRSTRTTTPFRSHTSSRSSARCSPKRP